MFVQATENEQIKTEIQQAADWNKISPKTIEKVDNNIRKEIQRSDPFKSESCGRKDCTICELESGVNCRARGCIYEMWCKECQRKYRGQTGVSADERIGKHFEDWKRNLETRPFTSAFANLPSRKTISGFGDPTTRRITKSVLIDELKSEQTMNGKSEWTYVKLNKVSVHW